MHFPTRYVEKVTDLEPQSLREAGINGLLIDIDGTLKDYRSNTFPSSSLAWIKHLRTEGIAVCLFSNGILPKVSAAGELFGVPFVAKAYKPSPLRVRQGLLQINLPANQVAIVGDQLFADVLAGRLAGLQTILVEPTSWIEPWFTRLKRPAEMPFRYRLRHLHASTARTVDSDNTIMS